ncbi:hypothetical protein BK009_01030 [Methanobacterium subterraneum]|uniref:Uncharacterized protein n=1 Tax=Methanobacterium subterraneum TaxID=59277 RepID=A0A2H4VMQ6_9EURY|nr:HEPN domain-containing protein [Methanobacterium subterraneum]AUB59387.1 hypothetical protein BK009_01030 [Methanobacterium subterraneum]
MNDKKKIEIINKIIDIAEKYVVLFRESPISKPVKAKELCFYVNNREHYYNPIVGDIFRDMGLKKNFSSNYVREFIDDLISDTLKMGFENVKTNPLIIDTFDDVFHEVTIYVPLSGIKMIKEELKIGKIVIKKMTDETVDGITSNLESLLRQNPYFFPKEKEEGIKFVTDLYAQFRGKVCAEFKMIGEEDIALKVAKEECERSLDLLRLLDIYLQSRDHNICISLEGETVRGYQNAIIFKSNFKHYKMANEFKGSPIDLEISDELIKKMKYFGIFILSEILEKPLKDLTDFEKTFLLGIHWFANFSSQREIENQYLSLMIALEIFLTPGSGEPITNYIAEGASIINEIGIENRKKLKSNIKTLYSKRSSIVHGRLDDISTEDDVNTLKNIILGLIFWMTQNSHRFESKDDLLNFIEDHKFACDILS